MPDRRAPWQNLPTDVLDLQKRTDQAAAWAQEQRRQLAQQWADLHLQDAYDSLGHLLYQSPATQEPSSAPVMPTSSPMPDMPPDQNQAPYPTPDAGSSSRPFPEPAPATDYSTPLPTPAPMAPDQGVDPSQRMLGPESISPTDVSRVGIDVPVPGPSEVRSGAVQGANAVGAGIDAAGDAITGQITGFGQDQQQMQDLSRAQFDAARRGESLPPEQDQKLADLSSQYGLALTGEPLANAAGKVAGEAAGEVARLRLDKFPEAVRSTIEEAAQRGDFWQQQRRNVIPDAAAEKMADELGRTVEQFVATRPGKAFNTEETRALRNALTGKALEVDDLKTTVEALGDKASDGLKRQLGQAQTELLALSRVAEGARAEAGRAFRAYITDTRGRLARSRAPEYTNISSVPIEKAAPAPGTAAPQVTEQLALPMTLPAQTGSSVYDKVALTRTAGMLSGIPTHLLNATANVVQGAGTVAQKPLQVGADIARVGVGRALGKDVERTRYAAEIAPQLEGYARGMWAGLQQVPGILTGGGTAEQLANVGGRRLASGSKVVDAAVEMPMRLLTASDAIFRTAALGGHAAALAERQAIQEGLTGLARDARAKEILGNISDYPGLLESANKLAARDVFQEQRAVTDAIAKLKRDNPGANVAADVFLPFYKTPYNVAAQGAGMTPAGYGSAIQAAMKGQTGEAIDRAVRATVGTVGMTVGFGLAQGGLLTGAYPATPTERSTLPEGWKPYSLRIPQGDGAVYVPIASLGSLAVPLGAAAVMVDAQKRGMQKDDPMKAVYAAVGGIGQFMGDMSALQGLNAISKLVTEPERTVESFSESLASSYVPMGAMARTVQQALGDAQRDPDNPLQAFLAGIPGLSQFVPTKQTPLGQDRARGPSGPVALVTGGRVGVEQPNTVTAALRSAGVGIPEPPKTVSTTTLKDIPLTEAEQRDYRRLAGDEISKSVGAAIGKAAWSTAPAPVRKQLLEDAIRHARDRAEQSVLNRIGATEARRRIARTAA